MSEVKQQARLSKALTQLSYAARSLFAKDPVEPQPFVELNDPKNRTPELKALLATEVPQASIFEDELEAFEAKNWRMYFAEKLEGHGLEIGPLHRPMLRHQRMSVDYIDRYTVAELRAAYPELRKLLLVEPHLIGDAQFLDGIEDGKYDFIVAAHIIEHMKNPILAIEHWLRVIKPGGLLYLIAPDKRFTFDYRRTRTSLEHCILDYREPSDERDYEHHLDYAIHVHHRSGAEAIEKADEHVAEDYSIHYHTFLPSDMKRLLEWIAQEVAPLEIVEGPVQAPKSDEFHFLVRKPEPAITDNR